MRVPSLSIAALSLLTSAASAATIRECPAGVELIRPAAQVSLGANPSFRWKGEPAGTASREVAVFDGEGRAVIVGRASAFRVAFDLDTPGAYGWFVTFRDARGNPICRSATGSLQVVRDKPVVTFATNGPPAPVVVGVYMDAKGRYVIVLKDSPYTGPRSAEISADDYDFTNYALGSAIGLVIHANNRPNNITGSPGHDLIWLYGGDDVAEGGAGNDVLLGGDGDDTLTDISPAGVNDIDRLYGGPGGDSLMAWDGDALDTVDPGSAAGDGFYVGESDNTRFGTGEPPPGFDD